MPRPSGLPSVIPETALGERVGIDAPRGSQRARTLSKRGRLPDAVAIASTSRINERFLSPLPGRNGLGLRLECGLFSSSQHLGPALRTAAFRDTRFGVREPAQGLPRPYADLWQITGASGQREHLSSTPTRGGDTSSTTARIDASLDFSRKAAKNPG